MQESVKERFAPIVMFVYNRADHFEQTYRALSKCPEAKDSVLFVFSDGPKNEAGAAKVQEVRYALRAAQEECAFKEFHIVESSENKGLKESIISGVSHVLSKYGRVIVLEDDCVVAPSFLGFMNMCLDTYSENSKVGSIAGFMPSMEYLYNAERDVFFAYRSCSMGWATWKDRWDTINWTIPIINRFYEQPKLIRKLNSCGTDRFLRLYRQTKGNSSSWSIRFGAQLVLNDQYTVYPRYSYVSNIGCDASGVHSRVEDAASVQVDLSKAIENPKLTEVEFDPRVQKAMKKHYSAGIVSDVKRFLATAGIVLRERLKR